MTVCWAFDSDRCTALDNSEFNWSTLFGAGGTLLVARLETVKPVAELLVASDSDGKAGPTEASDRLDKSEEIELGDDKELVVTPQLKLYNGVLPSIVPTGYLPRQYSRTKAVLCLVMYICKKQTGLGIL